MLNADTKYSFSSYLINLAIIIHYLISENNQQRELQSNLPELIVKLNKKVKTHDLVCITFSLSYEIHEHCSTGDSSDCRLLVRSPRGCLVPVRYYLYANQSLNCHIHPILVKTCQKPNAAVMEVVCKFCL